MEILIAEDDPISRRLLESTLALWGYRVVVTKNGKEAWDILKGIDAPGLAILDVMMPEMDGLEICRKVRGLRSPSPPFLILLTAMSAKDDVVNGIEAGANDYLSKPFHREELRVRVGVGVKMLELQKILSIRVKELEDSLLQVKQLQGMLPICSYCKQVRDDKNYWHKVENYISTRVNIEFSHGVCPDCLARLTHKIKEHHVQKINVEAKARRVTE
jgi:CheY-like chemotaxis protein